MLDIYFYYTFLYKNNKLSGVKVFYIFLLYVFVHNISVQKQ